MRRVDGHALKAHLRRGWFSGRRGRGPVYRPRPGRRPGCRAGLRAKPLAGGGPARRGNTCLRDERPAASTAARLSLEARRAGLVRDGVGKVAEVYRGDQRTFRGRSTGAAVPLQAVRGRPRHAGDPQGPARIDGAARGPRVPDPRAAPASRADAGTGSRVVRLRSGGSGWSSAQTAGVPGTTPSWRSRSDATPGGGGSTSGMRESPESTCCACAPRMQPETGSRRATTRPGTSVATASTWPSAYRWRLANALISAILRGQLKVGYSRWSAAQPRGRLLFAGARRRERRASGYAPRNGQVVQRREGLRLYLPGRGWRGPLRALLRDSRQRV